MKVGDSVVWADDMSKPDIHSGTLAKIKGDTCWLEGEGSESARFLAFMWPARAEGELRSILTKRAELHKAFDDSMNLVYELRNKLSRGEL